MFAETNRLTNVWPNWRGDVISWVTGASDGIRQRYFQ
jgi:hypothetical protein